MNDEELLTSIDQVLQYSKYYFYDAEYEKHINNILKLRRKIEKGEEEKYLRKKNRDESMER